jgi:hypothetical protein
VRANLFNQAERSDAKAAWASSANRPNATSQIGLKRKTLVPQMVRLPQQDTEGTRQAVRHTCGKHHLEIVLADSCSRKRNGFAPFGGTIEVHCVFENRAAQSTNAACSGASWVSRIRLARTLRRESKRCFDAMVAQLVGEVVPGMA